MELPKISSTFSLVGMDMQILHSIYALLETSSRLDQDFGSLELHIMGYDDGSMIYFLGTLLDMLDVISNECSGDDMRLYRRYFEASVAKIDDILAER